MTISLKVLWAEGLTLDAQHFQQLDLYHESRLRHIAAAINPFAWGVQLARWSIEGVASNSLYAKALTLIFKDGEIYQAPLSDELPLAIDLSKLPADEQNFVFYAALPVVKAHGGNLANGLVQRDDTGDLISVLHPVTYLPYARCVAGHFSEAKETALADLLPIRLSPALQLRTGGDRVNFAAHRITPQWCFSRHSGQRMTPNSANSTGKIGYGKSTEKVRKKYGKL